MTPVPQAGAQSRRHAAMRFLPVLFMGLIGLVLWYDRSTTEDAAVAVECVLLTEGCTQTVAGRQIDFGVDVQPAPMQPFSLWVRADGARSVEASFTMDGMDMGFNLYRLRADADGVFRGNVTLPVCVSGRRDWIMTLRIDETRLAVPFVTDM